MKNFLKHNILLVLLIVMLLALGVTGILFARRGVTVSDDGTRVPYAALGLFGLSEGENPFGVVSKNDPNELATDDGVQKGTPDGENPNASGAADNVPGPGGDGEKNPDTTEPQVTPAPTAEPTPEVTPEPTPEPIPPHYEWGTVDESYFENACFIGDSRIHGLYLYSGMKDYCDFYSRDGMSVFGMVTGYYDGKCKDKNGLVTIDYFCPEDGFKEKQYERIYIMTGLNECGTNDPKWFQETYREDIDAILELQPNAKIIIMASLHVTAGQDKKTKEEGKRYDNEHIRKMNDAAMELVDNENVFWLDVNPLFDDEDGKLSKKLSSDGIHPKAACYVTMKEFLMENGLVLVE